ncbi:MAG: hypothetical protein OXG62_11185 [Nitrospinae bacterium]|nr:hypothetical protein [Nitrospinota bacterium]
MTFREKSITKLYAFAMAAVFALVLAGCGGGGGGTAATPDPPAPVEPEPTPQETCEADGGRYNADGSCTSAADLAEEMALSGAQSAAMAAYMAAAAAVSGAKDPVAAGNAQMYAAMAKEASDAAAMATTSAMAGEYQMKAETAQGKAEMAAGTRGLGLTMLANKELNTEDIRNAGLEGKDPPKPVNNAKNVGTAMAAATAAAAVTGMTNQGGISAGTQLVVAEIAGTAVADHKKTGSTFAVGMGTDRLLVGETPSRFQTKGGWEAQDLLLVDGTDATLKTHLVISTDIQADTQNYDATASTTDTITVGTSVIVAGEIARDGKNFAVSFNSNPADNRPPVAGQFQCNTTPCSISVDESGKIVANQNYTFHESTGITDPDGDYLAWGMWVQASTIDDASSRATPNLNAQAGAFAYGSDQFDVKAVLTDTATYNGDATGLYSAGGMVEYFDADVTLEANFGGTVGADSTAATADNNDGLLVGAVTGTVSNIRAGGMAVDGMLTLKRAPLIDTNADAANGGIDQNTEAGTFTGPFTGDVSGTLVGRAMAGNWGGQFYGPSGASGKAAETQYPTTAAGTFAAEAPGHSADPIRIMGSFGTWKAE